MSKVLEIQNLRYSNCIKDVSFTWKQGEIIALMGENGSGKSTLARLIAGLLEPSEGTVCLNVDGIPSPWSEVKRWQEIGLVGQHPRRQTVGASVAEEISFGLLNLGLNIHEVRKKVQEIAASIGLGDKLNQSPATLSGGERQRLVTAAILALQPSFLILDEALSMLDARAQAGVLELLGQQKKTGQLWITHDPELALRADRVLLLQKGTLEDALVQHDRKNRSFPEIRKGYECRDRDTRLIKSDDPDKQKVKRGSADQPVVLEWRNTNYNSRLSVTKTVRAGEFIGIVGPSGSGKTTLLESAIGLILPTEGQFLAYNERITKENLSLIRSKIRIVLQEAGEYLIGRTVLEEIYYGESMRQLRENWQDKLRYLKKYGLFSSMAELAPECLSGGERQKVALASALRTRPEILLMDEPLLGLDALSKATMQALISEMENITILYVTHDLRDILPNADRIWLVEKGQITLDCSALSWKENREQFRAAGVRC